MNLTQAWSRRGSALAFGALLALAACASRQAGGVPEFEAAAGARPTERGAGEATLAAPAASGSAADLFEKGRRLMAQGEPTQAALAFEQILRLTPDDAVALNNLGIARASMGDYRAAYDCLQRAAAMAPQRADIAANLAVFRQWRDARLNVRLDSPREDRTPAGDTAASEPVPALWPLPPNSFVPAPDTGAAATAAATGGGARRAAGAGSSASTSASTDAGSAASQGAAGAASLEPGETVIEDAPGILSHGR